MNKVFLLRAGALPVAALCVALPLKAELVAASAASANAYNPAIGLVLNGPRV